MPSLSPSCLSDQSSIDRSFRITLPDGSDKWLRFEATAHTRQDEASVWNGYLSDVSAERERDERIAILTERFHLANTGADIGVWDFDLVNGGLIWDDQMHKIYGTSPDSVAGLYQDWSSCLSAKDVQFAERAVQRAIDDIEPYNIEFRITRQNDGVERWIHGRAVVQRDEEGKAIRMVGINEDITDTKQVSYHLERFFYMSSDPLCILSLDFAFVNLNEAWTHILGYDIPAIKSLGLMALIHPDDTQVVSSAFRDLAPHRNRSPLPAAC